MPSALGLVVMEGVLGIGMVGVMGCFVWWVDLGGVGIRGSRYFPKAGILHPEA